MADGWNMDCAICLETFATPVTLGCGHTFCSYCISQSFANNPVCPQCRAPIDRIPNVNIVMKSILEQQFANDEEYRERCARKYEAPIPAEPIRHRPMRRRNSVADLQVRLERVGRVVEDFDNISAFREERTRQRYIHRLSELLGVDEACAADMVGSGDPQELYYDMLITRPVHRARRERAEVEEVADDIESFSPSPPMRVLDSFSSSCSPTESTESIPEPCFPSPEPALPLLVPRAGARRHRGAAMSPFNALTNPPHSPEPRIAVARGRVRLHPPHSPEPGVAPVRGRARPQRGAVSPFHSPPFRQRGTLSPFRSPPFRGRSPSARNLISPPYMMRRNDLPQRGRGGRPDRARARARRGRGARRARGLRRSDIGHERKNDRP